MAFSILSRVLLRFLWFVFLFPCIDINGSSLSTKQPQITKARQRQQWQRQLGLKKVSKKNKKAPVCCMVWQTKALGKPESRGICTFQLPDAETKDNMHVHISQFIFDGMVAEFHFFGALTSGKCHL